MVTSSLVLLIAIIGLLIYVLAANGKAQEIGRALMWCGFLVALFMLAGKTVHLP